MASRLHLQRKELNMDMLVEDPASFRPKSVVKKFSLARTELGTPEQTEYFKRFLQAALKIRHLK